MWKTPTIIEVGGSRVACLDIASGAGARTIIQAWKGAISSVAAVHGAKVHT